MEEEYPPITKESLIEGYLKLYLNGEPTHLIVSQIKKVALDDRVKWEKDLQTKEE
jgi:hypothetical protein